MLEGGALRVSEGHACPLRPVTILPALHSAPVCRRLPFPVFLSCLLSPQAPALALRVFTRNAFPQRAPQFKPPFPSDLYSKVTFSGRSFLFIFYKILGQQISLLYFSSVILITI